jgi:FtsH-binding integral membrane protein
MQYERVKQPPVVAEWPEAKDESDDFSIGATVDACEAAVRAGFLRKVFGIVAAQLLLTAAMAALFMFTPPVREFVIATPSLLMLTFFSSLGFLCAAHANKDRHPVNLYYVLGFTVSLGYSVGVTCALHQKAGLGLVVLEAVGLTGAVTTALTLYALRTKKDFSYLGSALGSALFVLIFGGLVASLTGLPALHFALAVGGAAIFSLYIIYDVQMISKRVSPDEYVPAAITLYLDIVNLVSASLPVPSRCAKQGARRVSARMALAHQSSRRPHTPPPFSTRSSFTCCAFWRRCSAATERLAARLRSWMWMNVWSLPVVRCLSFLGWVGMCRIGVHRLRTKLSKRIGQRGVSDGRRGVAEPRWARGPRRRSVGCRVRCVDCLVGGVST